MTKKLSIFLVAALTVAPLLAQPVERSGSALFAPRAGQWQVNLMLGRGLFFPIEDNTYLLPGIVSGSNFGIAGQGLTKNQSDDPSIVFHVGSLNNNSVTNIAGIQGKYFITNRWEVNGMFMMDIGVQPQRHYQEYIDFGDAVYPGLKYVQGRLQDNWMGALGTNYYFNNCNGRIFPYLGVLGSIQHARIQVTLPYTGDELGDELWTEIFYAHKRAGEVFGFTGAITAGIEYNFLPGLNVAIEVRPFNYMYTLARVYSDGLNWNANAHTISFFALPQLKFGIRF
ncbi:MAG: hypothetical protein LBC84_01875 [Prevotellaceae bacterium]|jgi:hypothetical protein|nr:hypothetical protein [Prevotellaceae bacterium]